MYDTKFAAKLLAVFAAVIIVLKASQMLFVMHEDLRYKECELEYWKAVALGQDTHGMSLHCSPSWIDGLYGWLGQAPR